MNAIVSVAIVLWGLLPSRYVVATLPVMWITQFLFFAPNVAIFSAGPLEMTLADMVILSLVLRCAFGIASRGEFVVDRGLYVAIFIFLVVNFLATLAAGVKFGQSQCLRGLTAQARLVSEMALVPVMAHAITTLPQAKRCIVILLAPLVPLVAIQFINFLGASHGFVIGEVQGMERGEERYFGPLGDSVGFVLLLGYVVSLCFASVVGAGAFLGGILLTAGLGAIFAAGLSTVIFLLIGMQSREVQAFARQRLWVLPLVAFAGLAAVTVFARPMAQTLVDRLSSGNYSTSGTQRLANATLAGAMIADNPMFGVGFMGYEPALARYGGEKFFDLEKRDGGTANANNQFLQSLTDAGLPGLAAAGALVFVAAQLFLRIARRSQDRFLATIYLAAFIWLLSQVLGNLAAVWLIPGSFIARLLWILLGTAVAIQRLQAIEAVERPLFQQTPRLVPA